MGVKDVLVGRLLGNAGKFSDAQVMQTLQLLVEHGVKRSASDIHIEPHDQFALVRYRIDGTLRGIHKLPLTALPSLIERLKEQAGLDPNEKTMPQDGHYSTPSGGQSVEVRVSVMPVLGGEKAVLHLTLALAKPFALEALGLWGHSLALVQDSLAHPHGLMLVSGPKHSGISTTLHSLVGLLNTPLVSIATIEDHVKYRVPGTSQTYAHKHASLVENLQAVLRQDPNIVAINRLNDKYTAELAVHAAVTGHLIIAGLHADSSPAALLRLRSLGVEPFLLASAARLSISQRLVRRLCGHCRERFEPTPAELKDISKTFGVQTPAAGKRLHTLVQEAMQAGLGSDQKTGTTASRITTLWRAHSGGCEACDHTGYQGRTAIVEVLPNSEPIQKALMSRESLSEAELHAIALKHDFIPMALDGLVKALCGETTTDEVLRVMGHA